MKRFTNGLVLGVAFSLIGAESLQAQSSEDEQLNEATDITVLPSADMADLLRSKAATTHCCTTDKFLDGAILYKRAAEHGLEDNPSAIDDLRAAAYFFFYAGEFDRAFNAIARVGVIERDRGNRKEAAQAFLEAAHIARWSGDTQRALEILLASQELSRELESGPTRVTEKP